MNRMRDHTHEVASGQRATVGMALALALTFLLVGAGIIWMIWTMSNDLGSHGPMMAGYGGGAMGLGAGALWMAVIMLLPISAILVLLIRSTAAFAGVCHIVPSPLSAASMVDQRYAAGEIDRATWEAMHHDLNEMSGQA